MTTDSIPKKGDPGFDQVRTPFRLFYSKLNAEASWSAGERSHILPLLERGLPELENSSDYLLGFGTDADLHLVDALPSESFNEQYRAAGNLETVLLVDAPLSEHREPPQFWPFAVTAQSLALAQRLGAKASLPALEKVVRVNSKRWSAHLRQELGLSYRDQRIESIDELLRVSTRRLSLGERLVLKEDFGVAGSGSMQLTSVRQLPLLSKMLLGPTSQSKEVGWTLEPWLQRAWDFSTCAEITREGKMKLLGYSGMINLGTAFAACYSLSAEQLYRIENDKRYQDAIVAVVKALHVEGYYGPFCIDSMVLQDGTLIAIVEINARMSLGMLNLAQRARRVKKGSVESALFVMSVSGRSQDLEADFLRTLAEYKLAYREESDGHGGCTVLGVRAHQTSESNALLRLDLYCVLSYIDVNALEQWLRTFELICQQKVYRIAGRGLIALKRLAYQLRHNQYAAEP